MFLFCLSFFCAPCFSQEKFQDRWFYASFGLQNDEAVNEMIDLLKTAKAKDFNGMLWACGVDNCDRFGKKQLDRLMKIKKAADENGIEIIPIIWSVGYGSMLGYDNNLAEGQKITNLKMIAKEGKLVVEPTLVEDRNSGMEQIKGKQVLSFYHDRPGIVSYIDDKVKHGGNVSIRFENFTADKYGHGRLSKVMSLKPNQLYRVSIWMKTEQLQGGNVMLQMYRKTGQTICSNSVKLPKEGTSDWTRHNIVFNSGNDGQVRFYTGIWGGKSGKFWLDDFEISELGLCNPLNRPGTPFVVKNAENGTVYEAGRDYILPKYSINFYNPEKSKAVPVLPEGSRITEGTKVLVDYYTPVLIGNHQISACMSEPKLYEYFEKSAQAIMKTLAPQKWFLSMDEIRAGGSCQTCQDSGLSLAEILGNCITKQFEIIRKVQPNAQVYIWSDMIDPNHNCHNNYYNCRGDYTGAWKFIPKDLIISCWYHKKRAESMKFFSDLGFKTQGAAYYDVKSLETSAEWLETCNSTPGCTGIMYTTWQHKYELLPGFGDLVREKSKPLSNNSK